MTEPVVALTDYGLAIECAIFVWLIARRAAADRRLARWVMVFFTSVAVATLSAGTMHGFFHDPAGAVHAVLWPISLLAIGLTALAGWVLGARMTLAPAPARWVARAAVAKYAAYCAVVLFLHDAFWIAIVEYLPPTMFLLFAFRQAARRGRGGGRAGWGALGLVLTLGAAALQHFRIAPHSIYFDHNALYHLVQAIALLLIFVGFRGLLHSCVGSHADGT